MIDLLGDWGRYLWQEEVYDLLVAVACMQTQRRRHLFLRGERVHRGSNPSNRGSCINNERSLVLLGRG
jgi:hypothetical protein